jgi:hypothetical protein
VRGCLVGIVIAAFISMMAKHGVTIRLLLDCRFETEYEVESLRIVG